MNRYGIPALLIAALLLLTACGGQERSSGSSAFSPSSAEDGGQGGRDLPLEEAVALDYAGEELLSQTGSYDQWVDDDSAYQVKALFTASRTVRDFRFVELGFDIREDGEVAYHETKELYSQEQLSPERPLVIGMAFAGTIPDRGISYTDEDGAVRRYALSMSGKDGSLLLLEIS